MNKELEQKISMVNDRFLETLTDSLTFQLGMKNESTTASHMESIAQEENEDMVDEGADSIQVVSVVDDALVTERSADDLEENEKLKEEVLQKLETDDKAITEKKN